MSSVKAYMRRFMVAGDSGYPISEVLMKPFPIAEAAQCVRKRLFNRRISGLRTVMSENINRVLKRRFPIMKAMRTDLGLSQKIIIATAVLFNLARLWRDEGPEDEDDDDDHDDGSGMARCVLIEEGDPGSVRYRGQVEREWMMNNMQ